MPRCIWTRSLKCCYKNSRLQLYLQYESWRRVFFLRFTPWFMLLHLTEFISKRKPSNCLLIAGDITVNFDMNSLTAMGTHYILEPGMQMHDYIYYKHQFPSHYSTECSLSCAQHCHSSLRFFVDLLLHILQTRSKMPSVDPKFDGLGT